MALRIVVAAVNLGLLMLSVALPAGASTKTIWEIGKYDLSFAEFAQAPQPHALYEVGKSKWDRDWPGTQNVGSDYAIQFELVPARTGVYHLRIGVFAYTTLKIPTLSIVVNGHSGVFYVNPQATYSTLEPRAPSDLLDIAIPAQYLRSGTNKIVLSCIDPNPSNSNENVVSGIRYDALSLTEDESGVEGSSVDVRVKPTVFYRQRPSGLTELVEAVIRFAGPSPAGEATLDVKGSNYSAKLPAVENFGEVRVQFELPAWIGTIPGKLVIHASGHRSFDVRLKAARRWKLFVVPHTHLDVGFTDFVGKVAEIQSRELDQAVALIHDHSNFRFTTDGSWSIDQYFSTRSTSKRDKILSLAREDKIGIPANYANLLTGYASLETLFRSLYYSKQLANRSQLPFTYASTTDVPTYSGAYPSILASAGIRYWAAGPNADRAPFGTRAHWIKESPFWWEGPDGKRVLFWYARNYRELVSLFGVPPTPDAGRDSLPILLEDHPDSKVDALLVDGSQEENVELIPQFATIVDGWNREYAYPKLEYATFTDFFTYVDSKFGRSLPIVKGELGDYWEDGVGADALYTAEDRDNQTKALSAEIVSTIAHNVDPSVYPMRVDLESAWKDIQLFAEHTWRTAGSEPQETDEKAAKQLTAKDDLANDARFRLENVTDRAMSQLADSIHIPGDTLVIFNPLNWKRSALVETAIHEDSQLIDLTTGEALSLETFEKTQGHVLVRFLAKDIPPVGYKCFQIRSLPQKDQSERKHADSSVDNKSIAENQFYRITLDPETGAIKSIFDKQLQRELVDGNSPYTFGQYLYVTGGDGQTRIVWSHEDLPRANLAIHPAQRGTLLGVYKTAWGQSIRLRSSDTNTPQVDLEIRLFDAEKKVELAYTVQKQYTSAKEGVYIAFPVASPSPRFLYTNQQTVIDPAKDLLEGAGLEWFAVQDWMAEISPEATVAIVPIDAPLASFGDINRGLWPSQFHPATSTIFSYVMNNYWHTNYPTGQAGTFSFRYVITSAKQLDASALSRIGREGRESVVLDHVVRQDKTGDPIRPLPSEGTSFLQTDAQNIVLLTWKLAEDGKGTIMRLLETSGKPTEATIALQHAHIRSAQLCDSVEDNLRDLKLSSGKVHLTFRPHEAVTVRLLVGDER